MTAELVVGTWMDPSDPRRCQECGSELVRREYTWGAEDEWHFSRRRYCNRSCGARASTQRGGRRVKKVDVSDGRCLCCGEDLVRKRYGGEGRDRAESWWSFARRRYCSRSCAALAAQDGELAVRLLSVLLPQGAPTPIPESCGHRGAEPPYMVRFETPGGPAGWSCRRCGQDVYDGVPDALVRRRVR